MKIAHRRSNQKRKMRKASVKTSIKHRKNIKIKKKRSKPVKNKNKCYVKTTEERRNRKIQQKLIREQREIQALSNKISSWLSPEKIDSIAVDTGFLKKLKSKIPPLVFMVTLAYGMYNNGAATYMDLAASMAGWFNVNITPQAIFGRLSKKETANFLKSLLVQAMTLQITNGFKNAYAVTFSQFSGVKIEDSTQFELHEKVAKKFKGCGGSASKSAMKLNTVYDMTNNTISHLDIVSGATPDQALSKNMRKQIKKDMLWIRDLGYFSIPDMQWIHSKFAYFLSRMKKGVHIFLNERDRDPVNIEAFLDSHTKNGNAFDEEVYVGEGAYRLKVRIIGEKVPEEVKQKRIDNYRKNKIKRDKKKKMKEDYVVWFGYSVFITNAPRGLLASAAIIMAVYKIRWQIELFFKRIKSILQIHVIKGRSVHRVHCLIYGKLISLLMAQTIVSYAANISDDDEELSEHKLMVWLQTNNRLVNAIIGVWSFESLFKDLIDSYYLLCRNKRQKSKSTLRIIQEVFKSDEETTTFRKVA